MLHTELDADEIVLAAQFADAIAYENIVELGSSASLDRSPRSNWVEETEKATGKGLPPYVREVARSIEKKRGIPLSRAIPMAIGTIKRWARGGGDVTPETRAKAAKAYAGWMALRAANKARQAKGN